MSRNRTKSVKVEVEIDGEVVKTLNVKRGDAITVRVISKPPLPSRSPLHERALTRGDLRPGLNIQRQSIRYSDSTNRPKGIVTDVPFRRGSKFGENVSQAHCWMVPVVTTDYSEKLVQQDWYLADMGVAPYVRPDGSSSHWNPQNYTLAD